MNGGKLSNYMVQLANAEAEGERRIAAMTKDLEAQGMIVERHGDEITVRPKQEGKTQCLKD